MSTCSKTSIYIYIYNFFWKSLYLYFIINVVGGGGLKKKYYQIDPTQGKGGPDFSSAPTQHNDDNPDIETEEEACPRSEHSSEDCR